MKEYIISLDLVTSASVTASQLSELIGVEEAELTSRPSKSVKNGIYWRFEPSVDDKANLAAGIEFLNSNIQPRHPTKKGEDIKDIYLSVAAIFDSFHCSIYLSCSTLAPLTAKLPDLGITITTYPTHEDEEDDPSGFMRWYHRNQREKGALPLEIERDCVNEYYEEWENMGRPGAD